MFVIIILFIIPIIFFIWGGILIFGPDNDDNNMALGFILIAVGSLLFWPLFGLLNMYLIK